MGARALVVQDALETIFMLESRLSWLTPMTNMGVSSLAGADMITCKWKGWSNAVALSRHRIIEVFESHGRLDSLQAMIRTGIAAEHLLCTAFNVSLSLLSCKENTYRTAESQSRTTDFSDSMAAGGFRDLRRPKGVPTTVRKQ